MTELPTAMELIAHLLGIPESLLLYFICALAFLDLVYLWSERTVKGNI
jgi:hypothetical protein